MGLLDAIGFLLPFFDGEMQRWEEIHSGDSDGTLSKNWDDESLSLHERTICYKILKERYSSYSDDELFDMYRRKNAGIRRVCKSILEDRGYDM